MANKLTEKAGLTFNVNTVKANMTQFLKVHDLLIEHEKENDKGKKETVRKTPKFSGAHVAVTAALQELCTILTNNALQHTHKDKSGMRTLTRQTLRSSVLMHDGLKQYYHTRMQSFDKTQVYENQVPVAKKDMLAVIKNVNGDLKLTPKALNFMYFLLHKVYSELVHTSYQLVEYAKKKTLDARSCVYALQLRFADSVAVPLHNEVSRATSAVGDDGVEKADDEDNDNDNDESAESDSDNDEEQVQAKGKGKGKGKGKAVKKVDSEDESSDESLEDSDSDESSEEEVVSKKPAAKGKGKAKTPAKKANAKKPAAKKQTARRANK